MGAEGVPGEALGGFTISQIKNAPAVAGRWRRPAAARPGCPPPPRHTHSPAAPFLYLQPLMLGGGGGSRGCGGAAFGARGRSSCNPLCPKSPGPRVALRRASGPLSPTVSHLPNPLGCHGRQTCSPPTSRPAQVPWWLGLAARGYGVPNRSLLGRVTPPPTFSPRETGADEIFRRFYRLADTFSSRLAIGLEATMFSRYYPGPTGTGTWHWQVPKKNF